MGMVNRVVPPRRAGGSRPGVGQDHCGKSPTAQRMLKFAFNAIDDGLIGQQVFAGESTRLAYMTDEAVEGRDAFLEKRPPTGLLPLLLLTPPTTDLSASQRAIAPLRFRQVGVRE